VGPRPFISPVGKTNPVLGNKLRVCDFPEQLLLDCQPSKVCRQIKRGETSTKRAKETCPRQGEKKVELLQ